MESVLLVMGWKMSVDKAPVSADGELSAETQPKRAMAKSNTVKENRHFHNVSPKNGRNIMLLPFSKYD